MNLRARLEKVERFLDTLPDVALGMRSLEGKSREEVVEAVREATRPAAVPVLEQVLGQAKKFDETYARQNNAHGFTEWLDDLQKGRAPLPEVIPSAVLHFWQDDHADQPTQSGPNPSIRCFRCGMVLPGQPPDPGWHKWRPWERCPVCDAFEFGARDWSRPGKTFWWKGKTRYVFRGGGLVPG